MNWYLLVRFIHILSSIVFIGGILARQAVRMQGKKSTDVHSLAAYFLAAGKIESFMVIPGNMLVIIFGVILAIMVRAPIFGFLQGSEQNWLLVTNILLILGGLNVPLISAMPCRVAKSLLGLWMKPLPKARSLRN